MIVVNFILENIVKEGICCVCVFNGVGFVFDGFFLLSVFWFLFGCFGGLVWFGMGRLNLVEFVVILWW